jgi:hypothetical protein
MQAFLKRGFSHRPAQRHNHGMTGLHPALVNDEQLLAQCRLERLKRSGPGGQRRNKVETAVRLKHLPTGVVSEASERRSAAENQAAAMDRLRRLLAVEIRSESVTLAPSPLWRSRTAGGRISLNPAHADVPAMLAEALDQLAAADWDITTAAQRLEVTATQLTKLLKYESAALDALNSRRVERGLRPLN